MNKISLFQLVFLTVGAMVGSAIFSLSGLTILNADGSAVLSWALAGLLLLGFGLVTTNLVSAPGAGSSKKQLYDFPALAFKSNFLSYLTSWIYLFGCIAGVSFSATYFAYYLAAIFPVLVPVTRILSTGSVLLVFVVNLLKIRSFSRINTVLTILLVALLLVFVAVLCIFSGGGHDVSILPTSLANLGESLAQVPTAMLAYGAIVVPAFMVSSVKNPQKNVRLSMVIAMILTTVLYCLVIFGTLRFVGASYFVQHPEAAYSPLTAALEVAKLPAPFVTALNVAAVLALFTTMLVVGKLGATSIENIMHNQKVTARISTEKLSVRVFFGVVLVVTLFYSKVQLVVDSGALFNVLFTLIICASGFKLAKKTGHKVLAMLVAVVVTITYIPALTNHTFIAMWLVTICYLALGIALYKIPGKPTSSTSTSE
jgi:amino acid transporter